MTVPPVDDVVLGETHLLIGGELVTLFKCPVCNFRNIHEDEIRHHIKWHDDLEHVKYLTLLGVGPDKIDGRLFIVIRNKDKNRNSNNKQCLAPTFSHSPYIPKEDLPDSLWPYIKCVWCDYKDRLPRDLQWHFIEQHKPKLYQIRTRLGDYERNLGLEYVLDKALNIAIKKSRREGDNPK